LKNRPTDLQQPETKFGLTNPFFFSKVQSATALCKLNRWLSEENEQKGGLLGHCSRYGQLGKNKKMALLHKSRGK
jgi:hypothetical protein